MALFPRVHTWVSNEVLTAADLNAEFDNILTNAKVASMVGYSANTTQMQTVADPGGVGSESLAGTGAEELTRLRYKIKQLIGGAQWYSTPVGALATGGIVTGNYAAGSVDTAALAALGVTGAKLAAATVTKDKLAALGQQISASSGTVSVTSGTYADVTNLTVTITTLGRPVFVGLMPAGSTSAGSISILSVSSAAVGPANAQTNGTLSMQMLQGATPIATWAMNTFGNVQTLSDTITFTSSNAAAPGSFWFLDTPAAGTYVYKLQAKATGATPTGTFTNCVLVAFELG